jgi:hypothetical protein
MLYAVNPVGFGSMIISAGVSIVAFFGGLGAGAAAVLAAGGHRAGPDPAADPGVATRGKYYLRRTDDGIELPMYDEFGNPSGTVLHCHVCRQDIERPDVVKCETHDAVVCSLCLSQDKVGDHVLPATA